MRRDDCHVKNRRWQSPWVLVRFANLRRLRTRRFEAQPVLTEAVFPLDLLANSCTIAGCRGASIVFVATAVFCSRREGQLVNHKRVLRLMREDNLLRSLFLFDESPTFWNYLSWLVSSIIFFPGALYLYQVVGERLRTFLRWLLIARAVYAVFEIVAAALGVGLATLGLANNIKVLATLVATVIFLAVARSRPGLRAPLSSDIRVLAAGFFVWVLFILHTNLVGLKVIRGQNVEVLGCLVFVACLGYVSANRTFANEERLLAINKETGKAGFSPPRFRNASPRSRDSKLLRATSP